MNQKFPVLVLLIIAIIIMGIILFPNSIKPNKDQTDQPKVGVTIFPIFDIAQNVAGPQIEVELILPQGASPHTFDPSPSTLIRLQGATTIYSIGLDLDGWINDVASQLGADEVSLSSSVNLRSIDDEHDDETAHAHGEYDPHYWLDPINAQKIAVAIASDLKSHFPEMADQIDANLTAYLVELEGMDLQITSLLEELPNRKLITFHDAWYYFANAYDLDIAGTFEPTAGREPTPQYLADLTETLEASDLSVIYSEPQFGTAGLGAFADDNNLTIVELDPIGGQTGRQTYIELMLYNANLIKENQ